MSYGSYVGHVGFVHNDLPFVLPVNYLFDDDRVIFRTQEGTILSKIGGRTVAFEVDDHRALEHSGWSVLIHGQASVIDDPLEIDRLHRGPLRAWAWNTAECWVAISVDEVSGRRILDS